LNTHQRTSAISDFQNEVTQILVTTNLGSRGLDMNVGLVVEYEMCTNVVDYINRAGRTARFGKEGTSNCRRM
jgi:superfamily II DNA/RNA helicase